MTNQSSRSDSALSRRGFLEVASLGFAASVAAPALDTPVSAQTASGPNNDGKLRIICFGAHPDDCEVAAGGTAAKWAANGHHVKFVSCTNGDIGHWSTAGGLLAARRKAEVLKCAQILGTTTDVLDIHDGELMVTMDNRRTICRLIRQWNADVVISHRPNDYHPDHRYVGVLVMDAAYMVTVPFFCPDTPYLKKNPVFLFCEDQFSRPNPFTADVVVSIDDTVEKKLAAVDALVSQFYEGGCNGSAALVPDPSDAAAVAARNKAVRDDWAGQFAATANRFRTELKKQYGEQKGTEVKYAEAFEVCEYGRQPSTDEMRDMFPFTSAK
jgi:N-acetylglucosamine malate deacetylase 1